jgi:DNA-binding XRE family transcriptional regulator
MRVAAGETQASLAEALGCSQPTVAIGEKEATARTLTLARLLDMAEALDGRIEVLFYPATEPAKKKSASAKKTT